MRNEEMKRAITPQNVRVFAFTNETEKPKRCEVRLDQEDDPTLRDLTLLHTFCIL